MHRNAENKLFLTCKTINFSKKSLFLFKYDKIFKQQSYRNFTQIYESLLFQTVLKNLFNKTSFRATDLNYEINLFAFVFSMQKKKFKPQAQAKGGMP